MTKPLRTCPHCGAWLDSGERCDCQDGNTAQEVEAEEGQQATENPRGPVLVPVA